MIHYTSKVKQLDRIADSLEVDAIVRRDGLIEQSEMALDGNCHCLPIALPECGTPLDIGAEEDDGAARPLGHAGL